MKLFNAICFSILCSGSIYAQDSVENGSVDSRLMERYSKSEIKDMKKDDPDQLAMLTYALDHAIYITDYPKGKNVNFETIQLVSEENLTFVALDLEIKSENQYFQIEGQDKLLVVKSSWVLNHEMSK